ncbi:hypothetical protein FHG87_019163 [Trinorchestia longiramus]|nr:hypothetical protein FHG87_019163 [Trinorchestia longiramus]
MMLEIVDGYSRDFKVEFGGDKSKVMVINAFSFASFGADVIMPPGRGSYCFRLQGQTYHFIPGLHPNNDGISHGINSANPKNKANFK